MYFLKQTFAGDKRLLPQKIQKRQKNFWYKKTLLVKKC